MLYGIINNQSILGPRNICISIYIISLEVSVNDKQMIFRTQQFLANYPPHSTNLYQIVRASVEQLAMKIQKAVCRNNDSYHGLVEIATHCAVFE